MALLVLAFGAWFILTGHDEAQEAAPKVAQLGDTICDQFLAEMPPHGPERVEASTECKESLPSLPPADQSRILARYVAQMEGYITPEEIAPLVEALDKEASLPLRAHAISFVLHRPSPEIDEELVALREEAIASGDKVAEAHVLLAKGIRPRMRGRDVEEGSIEFEEALRISLEEEMQGFTPHVYSVIGRMSGDEDKFAEAIENFDLASRGFAASKDHAGAARIYNNLSEIYFEFYDYEKSIEYANLSIESLEKSGNYDHRRLKRAYLWLNKNLRELGRYEEAFDALEMANSPLTGPSGTVTQSSLSNALSDTLYAAGRKDEAFEVAEGILTDGDMLPTSGLAKSLRASLAQRYIERGDIKEAERHYKALKDIAASQGQTLEEMAKIVGSVRSRARFADSMVALFIALDKEEEALKFLRLSNELEARHVEHEAQKAVAGHTLQTALQERDESIDAMEVEAQNAQLQLTASRSQLALAVFSAVALGIIAFVAYRSFQTQKRLTATQERLAEQKNIYLDEIHHRTKNNFQVLSSILRLDIRRSDAVDRDGADKGGERRQDAVNRLETMALVHDHIYSLDAAKDSDADLSNFIDDLLALIDGSLGREGVNLEWNVDGGVMDVTRLTPFGLLLCELITNSYKHAFADSGGTITIEITEDDGELAMTLKDNGRGFDFDAVRNKPGRLGMGLIFDLADQVGGELTVDSSENGTVWTFR